MSTCEIVGRKYDWAHPGCEDRKNRYVYNHISNRFSLAKKDRKPTKKYNSQLKAPILPGEQGAQINNYGLWRMVVVLFLLLQWLVCGVHHVNLVKHVIFRFPISAFRLFNMSTTFDEYSIWKRSDCMCAL